jgi:hypothetical protein
MTAMGLTPRKLPIKVDDSYGLEAKNHPSRLMTAMGLRLRKSPVKANDSYGLEAKGIACRGQ